MKRNPVSQASRPSYPRRRSARWALGLLALGGTTLAAPGLVGCGNMTPPASHAEGATCAGDMPAAEPEAEPATSPEVGADPDPNAALHMLGEPATPDPNVMPETHIRGDMAAPDPAVPPEVEPAHVEGDMPDVDGDMVVPEVDPETVPEAQPEPAIVPEHDYHVDGGMPAPGFEPTQQPEGEEATDQAEPCDLKDQPVPGDMAVPHDPEPEPAPEPEAADED